MKKRIFLWSMRMIFLLSLFSVLFCLYQISYSHSQVDASLKAWEENKLKTVDQSPVTGIQFKSQQSNGDTNPRTVENDKSTQNLNQTTPHQDDVIGKITFPNLKKEFPIIEGTDQEQLERGVGHYIGSGWPGEADNTVLAGHRDTVFRELGLVKIGDIVEVETVAGSFTYRITEQRIVHQDDRTVIVPYDREVLTLITCYPFNFVGPAPDRFILVGELIEL
jgi:sortase A